MGRHLSLFARTSIHELGHQDLSRGGQWLVQPFLEYLRCRGLVVSRHAGKSHAGVHHPPGGKKLHQVPVRISCVTSHALRSI